MSILIDEKTRVIVQGFTGDKAIEAMELASTKKSPQLSWKNLMWMRTASAIRHPVVPNFFASKSPRLSTKWPSEVGSSHSLAFLPFSW